MGDGKTYVKRRGTRATYRVLAMGSVKTKAAERKKGIAVSGGGGDFTGEGLAGGDRRQIRSTQRRGNEEKSLGGPMLRGKGGEGATSKKGE